MKVAIQNQKLKETNKTLALLLFFLLVGLLAGCSNGGEGAGAEASDTVTSVEITPTDQSIQEGDTVFFTALAKNSNGTIIPDALFNWNSSNPEVARIDDLGLAIADAVGTTQITATVDTVTSSLVELTVLTGSKTVLPDTTIASVEVTPETTTIGSDNTTQLTVIAKNASGLDIPGVKFNWSSSNDLIATVNENGLVTGKSIGSATIIAAADGTSISDSATVLPDTTIATVEVTQGTPTIGADNTAQLTAIAKNAGGLDIPGVIFNWTSSNDLIAKVDSFGLVTGVSVSVDSETITATADETVISGSATVNGDTQVASVEVTPKTPSVVEGKTIQFSSLAKNAGGLVIPGVTFVWGSSSESNTSVDGNGLATGHVSGFSEITATANGTAISDSTTLTITADVTVVSVVVSPDPATMGPGNTVQLTVIAKNAGGFEIPGVNFNWSSSNDLIAKVDSFGLVTGVSVNSATITATADGTSISGSATVNGDTQVASVEITPKTPSVVEGKTIQFSSLAKNAGGLVIPGVTFSWGSSSESNASIDGNGLATGHVSGSSGITVSAQGTAISDSTTLTITADVTIVSVVVSPDPATMGPDNTAQFTAVAKNGSDKEISGIIFNWSSNDPSIVTVDSNGLVTGVSVGFTTITATASGTSISGSALVEGDRTVTSVEVSPGTTTIVIGDSNLFTAKAKNASGLVIPGVLFSWESDDTATATVDGNGLASGEAIGVATITATVVGTAVSGSANLNVEPLPGLRVTILGNISETAPVEGLRILRHDSITGAFIEEKATDVNGVADFGDIDSDRTTITVVSGPDHNILRSFMNIQKGPITLTIASGKGQEGQAPVATFDVTASDIPTAATEVEVFPLNFDGDTGSWFGNAPSGSATIDGVQAFNTKSDGTFSLLSIASASSAKSKTIFGCRFDNLVPSAINGSNLVVSPNAPAIFPFFFSSQNVDVGALSLRGENVVAQLGRVMDSMTGFIQFCDDAAVSKYGFVFETDPSPTNPSYVGIDIIRSFVPSTLGPILPALSVDTLTRSAATQTFNWTLSGSATDIGTLDASIIHLTWTDDTGKAFKWDVLFDGDPTSTGTKALTLPVLPVTLSDAIPPLTNVGFVIHSFGIDNVDGYDAAVDWLNQHRFIFNKSLLNSPVNTRLISVNRGEPNFQLEVTGTGVGNVVSDPAGINTAVGNYSANFTTGTDVTITAMPDSISSVFSLFAPGPTVPSQNSDGSWTKTFRAKESVKLSVNFAQDLSKPQPSSIDVSTTSSTINISVTVQFSAIARDAEGNVIPGVVFTWDSIDPLVANVDQSGLATGIGIGQTMINASAGGITGSSTIDVSGF